jgi:hypothetical protein
MRVPCRALRRLAGAGALVAALASSIAPASAALRVGFVDQQYARHDALGFYADAAALHVGVLRFNAMWRDIAPTRPAAPRNAGDPAYAFADLDALVRGAAAYGKAQVVLTIMTTPNWARLPSLRGAVAGLPDDNPTARVVAPAPAAAADFAYALATRYSGRFADPLAPGRKLPRVGFFEIGNEPSIGLGLYPQCATRGLVRGVTASSVPGFRYGCSGGKVLVAPTLYAQQLAASYHAIRQSTAVTGAGQLVLGGALSNSHSRPFLRELRRLLGKTPPFDLLSLHPYNATPSAGLRDPGRADGVSVAGFGSFVKLVDRLWPHRNLHFWLTEYGWQTEAGPKGVTEAKQAAFLADAITHFSRVPRVDTLVNYLIRDEAANRANAWQSGLRRLDGSPKPSFTAWRTTAARAALAGRGAPRR